MATGKQQSTVHNERSETLKRKKMEFTVVCMFQSLTNIFDPQAFCFPGGQSVFRVSEGR